MKIAEFISNVKVCFTQSQIDDDGKHNVIKSLVLLCDISDDITLRFLCGLSNFCKKLKNQYFVICSLIKLEIFTNQIDILSVFTDTIMISYIYLFFSIYLSIIT